MPAAGFSAGWTRCQRVRSLPGCPTGAIEDQATRRFVDAWHRARRMELLRYVRRHNVTSVRALAKALERGYSNVHADVQALAAAGLLDTADGGVHADYDAIETRIAS